MTRQIKYPRTLHLPWSEGRTNDDKVLNSTTQFEGKNVIITTKMDGENTTLYHDGVHARSTTSSHHPSRTWVKSFQAQIGHLLPRGLRICGENLYAKHSISYDSLDSYFLGFSAWDGNVCLGWDNTLQWFDLVRVCPVQVVWAGVWSEDFIRNLTVEGEGYVVRLRSAFWYEDFSTSVAKWVRKNHVQTDQHWMYEAITPNNLKR